MRQHARADETDDSLPTLAEDHGRGYQWKALFLPHDTQLRMTVGQHTYEARVEGDRILYQGRSVSPRGLTVAVAGDGRNAWRDLWIRFPGARHWKGANRCRIEAQAQAQAQSTLGPPLSPADSMRIAAAAMVQALDAALSLVKHSCAEQQLQLEQQQDRRLGRHRRQSDLLGESCAVD